MKRLINPNVTKVTTKKAVVPTTQKTRGGATSLKKDVISQSVKSSNLKKVYYNKTTRVLTIDFNSGRTYDYFAVPQIVYTRLLSANSKGTYFERNIRFKYKYKERK